LEQLKQQRLLKAFDYNGSYGFSKMLEGQIKGLNDSWAVRWHASAFLADKLTLYPGRSLVHNIGNDASGAHCGRSSTFDSSLTPGPIQLSDLVITPSLQGYQSFETFFRGSQSSYLSRIKQKISSLL
jgi:hypothetical protein